MKPACHSTPSTTYECCKLFISQLVAAADRNNWLVANKPNALENGYSFKEGALLILPEAELKFRIRRRHSIAIDQLLAQLPADSSNPRALWLHFLTLEADVSQKDPDKINWNREQDVQRFLYAEKKKAVIRKILQDGFAMDLKPTAPGVSGQRIFWQPFLRSASMSRRSILSFVSLHKGTPKAELFARNKLLAACSLDLSDKNSGCPKAGWAEKANLLLSKWNAYQGLALSDAESLADTFPCGSAERDASKGIIPLNEDSVVIVSDSIVFDDVYKSFCQGKRADFAFSAQWPHGVYYQPTMQSDGTLGQELGRMSTSESRAITPFDGMGFISPTAAGLLRNALHAPGATSFQIRLPMIKGMLVEVDFLQFLQRADAVFSENRLSLHRKTDPSAFFLRDIYGIDRKIDENVHFILTKSQFKAWRWFQCAASHGPDSLKDPVQYYFAQAAVHRHGLYVCRANKPCPEKPRDWLNYQILSTTGFSQEENIALADPTVQTLARTAVESADGDAARFELLHWKKPVSSNAEGQASAIQEPPQTDGASCFRAALDVCPELIYTSYGRAQVAIARARRAQAAQRGRLRVEGTTRFLIADPGAFLNALAVNCAITAQSAPSASDRPAKLPGSDTLDSIHAVWKESFFPNELPDHTVYVPGLKLDSCYKMCCGDAECPVVSLYRNPHLSQSEQTLALAHIPGDALYLRHLTGTVLLPARSMLPMRLGGADFDGDIARVISDKSFVAPLFTALHQSETAAAEMFGANFSALDSVPPQLPLVNMDPPQDECKEKELEFDSHRFRQADAELFLRTGQNKVGQYSNAAVSLAAARTAYTPGSNRSGENAVRLMTYAVGMEIDSAKTGRVVRLPKGFCSTKDMPFLDFNREVKRGNLNADIFSFYPRNLRPELDRKVTAKQAAAFLQDKLEKPGWLNILPYYLHRRQQELERELVVLHSLQEKFCVPPLLQQCSAQEILQLSHNAAFCGDQTPKAVKAQKFLASAAAYNKEQTCTLAFPLKPDPTVVLQPKLLAALAVLAGGYRTAIARQQNAAQQKELTSRMVQLLFYYTPGDSPDSYAKKASMLQDTLHACIPQGDLAVENAERAVKALQIFSSRTLTLANLLAPDRRAMLTKLLTQLCTALDTEFSETVCKDFLDLCEDAVTDGGYLLPALAAQMAAQSLLDGQAQPSPAELVDAQKNAIRTLLEDAQTPVAGQSTHDASRCFDALQHFYLEGDDGSFRREPLDSEHGQKHLRHLALQLTHLFQPQDEKVLPLRQVLLEHCLALADPALNWDAYFADPALQHLDKADRLYLCRVAKTEASEQKFLWECAGETLLQTLQAKDHSRVVLSTGETSVTAQQWLHDVSLHTDPYWQISFWRALRKSISRLDTAAEGGAVTHDS